VIKNCSSLDTHPHRLKLFEERRVKPPLGRQNDGCATTFCIVVRGGYSRRAVPSHRRVDRRQMNQALGVRLVSLGAQQTGVKLMWG